MRPKPPRAESAEAAAELAPLLRAAGYETQSIQERLATGEQLLARSPELPLYLRRLGDSDALAVLVRLFLLCVPVPRNRLEAHLEPRLLERLGGAGLLLPDGEAVHGAARIVPHDELLITSDHAAVSEGQADHVPGVHRPSVALAHLTVRGSGERALDLCTGNGIQAILLAAHAEHVVATDINERALHFAAFNAALNGAPNIETRHGSFFEPVEGELFDLVVANPPYVVSPENAYLFRDSGMAGDSVSEHLVRGVPELLAPGGFASILIAWALDPENPAQRPRAWLEGAGCDAFLLHTSTDDPLETASLWNRELLDRPEAYADALDRWLDYYNRLGIQQLGYACLALRKRRDGRDGELVSQPLPRAALRPAGQHVRRLFETRDRLVELDDAALLGQRLRAVDDAVVAHESRYSGGHWHHERLTLQLERGLPFSAELDAATATLIRKLDGSNTLERALATFEDETDRATGIALTRQMLSAGFLDFAS